MSFDLQAEGLNGVNIQTSVVAGHDWQPNVEEGLGSPVSTVLFVSGLAADNPSPANVDAMTGRGRLFGNGVTGFGGDQGGTGVIGVAGGVVTADFGVEPVTGQNAGVYGTGVVDMLSAPAVGVIGQGGPGTHGVEGRAGAGTADGVRGFGTGNFSGVAGFGDPTGNGIGVYGEGRGPNSVGVRGFGNGDSSGVEGFGNAKGNGTGVLGVGGGPHAQGVRGIGGGGTLTAPFDATGVYGQAGAGNAHGVEGRGSGSLAGVAGFGEAAPITRPVTAAGVYGQGGFGNNNGVEGRGTGNVAGVAGFGDASPTANSGIGVFAVGGAPAPGTVNAGGPGVHAIGAGGAGFTPLNLAVGVYGLGGADNAEGVFGQGGSAIADGVHGFSVSGNGVFGEADNGVGVRATSTSSTALVAVGTTGLFASSTVSNGTAADFVGNVLVNGNLTVTGVTSSAVPFPDGSHRRLYCVESPESWFEDFGFGELSNGESEVRLDPGFRSVVNGDAYHVFITEYGDNNALFVAERTGASFLVRAKAANANANGTFSYRVVAKRKDIAAPRFDKVDLPSGAR